MEDDYLDPIVAAIVGDNSGVLATIAETQAAMSEFAASAPTIGQFGPQGAGAEEAAAALQAGTAAAMAAQSAQNFAPLKEAAGAAGKDAGEELGRNLTEAEVAALSDDEFDQYVQRLQDTAAEAGQQAGTRFGQNMTQAQTAAAGDGGGAAMEARWAGFAQEAEAAQEAAAAVEEEGRAEEEAGTKAEEAGRKAADARTNWMLLGGVSLAVTAGPLALSAAIVGIGYEIANLGGEARGQMQIVDEVFRSSAAQAAQAFEPAVQNITSEFTGLARAVEPQMATMFMELRGPAEAFASDVGTSIKDGMQAAIPAVQAMGPVIAQIGADLDPLVEGMAGFVSEMAGAFTANGGNQWLAGLADDMGRLMPVVGELVGEVGSGLLPILDGAANVARILGDVLNGLGSPIDTMIIGGIAVARTWNLVTTGVDSAVNMWNKAVDALESVSGWISTHIGLTQADATATAAAATETEGMATALAAEGLAAEESTAGSAAAATGITAIGVAAIEAAAELATFLLDLAPFLALGYIGFEAGEALGNAISSGMDSSQGNVHQSAYNLGQSVQSGFNSSLQIASPSRVMTQGGQDAAAGVEVGLAAGMPGVNSAASAMGTSMAAAFATSVSGGGAGGGYGPSYGGGGGGGVTNYVTIHVEAPLASASASEIVDAILPALQDSNLLNGQSMASHTGWKGGAGR